MASNSLLSLNLWTAKPARHSIFPITNVSSCSRKEKLSFSLHPPRVAFSVTPAIIPSSPINVDYLEEEFSGHGVTFESIGDGCVAKLTLDNGSTATFMLPAGLVTSYKVPLWHGGKAEILQTFVAQGEDGEALIQGGLSLEFTLEGDDGFSWSPMNWSLSDIRGNPEESIQVELISIDPTSLVEVKYVLNLQEETLSSEIEVVNNSSSSVHLVGSFINHLNVSTPDATYAIGLEGSDYHRRLPILSKFSIVPPQLDQETGFQKVWERLPLKRFLEKAGQESGSDKFEEEDDIEGEEDDDYKQLTDEMSLIYTNAPTYLTIIDRGKRNSVVVGREGLDELYMHSPGSRHEFYSKYAYISIGPSAILKPLKVGPGDAWTGVQHLHNPNL